jgi:hypothetical protein
MKKILFLSFMAFILAMLLFSCEKATIDQGSSTKPYNPHSGPVVVKFSTDIIPIFTSKCTGCHGDGGQTPTLTAASAYASLTATPGQFINLTNPAASLLYVHITENPSSHGGGQFPAEGATILQWIQQGALNN